MELERPEKYWSFAYKIEGDRSGVSTFLVTYVCVVLASLLLVSGILGFKRLKALWQQAEQRRRIVAILGGVVSLWLVLFTFLLA